MIHAHVGFLEFLVTAAYIILFAIAWRTIAYRLRNSYPNAAGAMAYIF
jgi:hypothetical protein